MATKVGTVEIDVDVGTAKLQEGWDRAGAISKREAAKLQAQATALGSTIGTVLGNGISKGIDSLISAATKGVTTLAALGDMSEQFGLSVQTLSALRRESTLSGASFDTLSSGVRALSVAASSNSSVFKAMGISVKDSRGELKSTETLLGEVSSKFAGYEGSAAKAALAQKLFGDGGVALIPLLDQIGNQGLSNVIEKTRQAGALLGDDAANGAKQFTDGLHALQTAGDDFATSLASKLLPSLNDAAQLVSDPAFQNALDGISTSIAEVVHQALEATDALSKMYNRASAGVGVQLGNTITSQSGRDAAQQELDALTKLRQMGGGASVLGKLVNSWSPNEIMANSSALLRGTGAGNNARQDELRSQIAYYDSTRPNFSGVTGSYVGTSAATGLAAAPMLPTKTKDTTSAIATAAKSAEDAQRRLADLTERLQGQVAGPATQAWDSYAKSVRDAADAGAKQIEAAQKQVSLGDKSVNVAQVTANAQAQVEKAVNAATAAWTHYHTEADKAFDRELKDVDASISQPTKQLTQIAQAQRQYERALESLQDRKDNGSISSTQLVRGQAEYKQLLDQQVEDIKNANDEVNQFALQAARNIQDNIADTFYDMYTGVDQGLDGILKSWGDLIYKMLAQAQAAQLGKALFGDYANTGKVSGLLGSAIASFTGGTPIVSSADNSSALSASANASISGYRNNLTFNSLGNVYSGLPDLSAMSGNVYNSPQVFAFANGAGVLGEAGNEAIMPLARGADGKLGVRSTGGVQASSGVQVIVENHTDTQAQTKVTKGSDGFDYVRVIIDQAVGEVGRLLSNPNSALGKTMKTTYNVRGAGQRVGG